jgi:hypothetical protein
MTDQERYDQLAFYTLEHGRTDPSFIHQYIVDAYAAQHPTESAKTIRTAFALVGLYLHIEKHYSGKQVQLAHMALAKKRKQWPAFDPPAYIGDITVADVLRTKPGAERDRAIDKWCASVWRSWSNSHQDIRDLVRNELGVA